MELPGVNENLLGEEESEFEQKRFQPVVNLDLFFKQMYKYHYNRGLPGIILTQFCAMLTLGFTAVFSIFVLAFIDWPMLLTCNDEKSCHDLHDYVNSDHFGFSSFFGFLVMGYSILFFVYWLYRFVRAWHEVSQGFEMEHFYRDKLGINLKTLATISWNDVVQRLIKLHERKIYRVAVRDRLTEHDVVSRIMRKENYMIALINKEVLDLRLPWWASPFFATDKLFLTKSLESSIYYCVLMHIFNDQFNVSGVFLRDVKGLQGRFFYIGVIHFILLPFMLIFFIINFFLENTSQFHSSKDYLGPRQWSPLAIWQFREFNELRHVFETRINKSYAPANDYVKRFENHHLSIVSRCIAYLVGSFIAVLLLASIIDEAILLYVHAGDHNLLWYLGMSSAAYALAKSFIPDETANAHRSSPEELIDKVMACTHYKPSDWNDKCHTIEVRDKFLHLFPYKVQLFAMEILSVILTPVVLCFSLPQCAPDILEFIRHHTTYVDGIGAVCDYSTFDLNKYGNEEYATNTKESTMLEVNSRPENGKLEQSYISFQHEHPHWTGDAAGKNMLNRLKTYRLMKEHQQECELSTVLQNSMSMFGGSMLYHPSTVQHHKGGNGSYPSSYGRSNDESHGQGSTSPDSSMPVHMRSSIGSPGRNGMPFMQPDFSRRSTMARGHGVGVHNMPSMLRSILRNENIDYENDFYWLSKFQQEQKENPDLLEQSLLHSQMFVNSAGNMSTFFEEGIEPSSYSKDNDDSSQSKSSSVTSV